MRYSTLLALTLVASLLPAEPADAKKSGVADSIWVCAGYFERTTERSEASYGIRNYRERFLATKKGALRRAVFVFPVAYRIMHKHLRSQAATRFGEAGFEELPYFNLGIDVADAGKAPQKQAGASLQPGDQVAALPGAVVTAAMRWTSKPYNGVPSRNGWSELNMMALDGAKVVGRDSTLIVVWRYDSAEEWGTGKSGSLLSFGRHRVGETYVTSSEFALMERLRKLYKTPFTVLPLSDKEPLQAETAVLAKIGDWLEKYEQDSAQDLQAKNPGNCGR
jgi:hypothetical protein